MLSTSLQRTRWTIITSDFYPIRPYLIISSGNQFFHYSKLQNALFVLSSFNTELLWIKTVKRCSFGREIHHLNSPTSPCPVLVNQFGLFLDNSRCYVVGGILIILLYVCIVKIQLFCTWAHQKVKHEWCCRYSDLLTRKVLDSEGSTGGKKDYNDLCCLS